MISWPQKLFGQSCIQTVDLYGKYLCAQETFDQLCMGETEMLNSKTQDCQLCN